MNKALFLRFDAPGSTLVLVLEDDGTVAYAYLLNGDEIVGDVWLYNVAECPAEVEWNPANMPFLNPGMFCRDESVSRINEESIVDCIWNDRGVEVRIDGVLMARLEIEAKPGWSKLAACPGPLAKPFDVTS